jgi:hypothetical protein
VSYNATSVGTYSITVSTKAGTSNAIQLVVGDPTPVISSVSPDPWQAELSQVQIAVTVAGQGFGTSPTLSITGPPGVTSTFTGLLPDGSISTLVTIAAGSPGGTATVTVTASGDPACGGGSCFTQVNGQHPTTSATVPVRPAPTLPVPTIVWGQGVAACQNPTGVPSTVVVGQQIVFTACVPSSVPLNMIASMSWSPVLPQGSAVGGYQVAADLSKGTVVGLSAAECGSAAYCDYPMFYWVDQGAERTFTFTYTLSDGGFAKAPVTFAVSGPEAPAITANIGSVQVVNNDPGVPSGLALRLVGVQLAGLPGSGSFGATFQTAAETVNGIAGAGTHSWVQVVSGDHLQVLNPAAGGNGKGGVQTCVDLHGQLLDTHYPYPTRSIATPYDTATDSPDLALVPALAEEQRLFSATMYLMWDPTLPGPGQSSCSAASSTYDAGTGQVTSLASTCTGSIPVPLASVAWTAYGDAINTKQGQPNGTTFVRQCGPATMGQCAAVVPGTDPKLSFPTWGQLYHPVPNCN